MAYSLRTRTVITPRPGIGAVGARPFFTGALGLAAFSSNTMMTVNTGQWSGPRNTVAIQWYVGPPWSTVVQGSSASFLPASEQRGSSVGCTVSVTNPYGTQSVGITPIHIV